MSAVPVLEPAAAYALWAQAYPPHAHNPVMLAEERAMLDLMPASLQGQHVLDAGCGSGRYMLHALRRAQGMSPVSICRRRCCNVPAPSWRRSGRPRGLACNKAGWISCRCPMR